MKKTGNRKVAPSGGAIFAAAAFGALMIFAASRAQTPHGFFHPDALIFTRVCQASLETISAWWEIPSALAVAVRDCSTIDWNRGRITGYLLFLIGGVFRPVVGSGFFDPVALGLVGVNAGMLALVFRKYFPGTPFWTPVLLTMGILLSPFSLVATQVQFIYSKYVCTTFLLGALLASSPVLKLTCLLAGTFSDEIGLLFGMIYGGVLLAERMPLIRMRSFLRPAACWLLFVGWAGILWLGYHAALQICFGRLPTLMKKSKFLPGWEQLGDTFFFPVKTLLWGWGMLLLKPSSPASGNSTLAGYPWPVWLAPCLLLAAACVYSRIRFQPREAFHRDSLRDLACLLVTMLVVNFVFYKGQTGDFGYYGYPLFMGFTLLILAAIQFYSRPAALSAIVLVIGTTFLALPATQQGIRERVEKQLLSGVIPLERVAKLEGMILQTGRHQPLPPSFLSGQELALNTDNRFTEKYFPIKGIARNFLWPRRIPGPSPVFPPEP